MKEEHTLKIFLTQPENQKHWTYAEWLWMMVHSEHPYVIQALLQFANDYFAIEEGEFSKEERQLITYAAQWLNAGGAPGALPMPSSIDIPWIPA